MPPDPERLFRQADALVASREASEFARIAGTLYELRNLADYDPSREFFPDEVNASVAEARDAIASFRAATKEQQETFLTLLLFRPR